MKARKRHVFLLLGSNLGRRSYQIKKAISLLSGHLGPVVAESAFYETEPWGVQANQDPYLNKAVRFDTDKSARDLLNLCLETEQIMGRVRDQQNEPRKIDIDILLAGDEIIDTDSLKIPHPRMNFRNFALIPLMEIAAEVIHPVENKTIEDLYFDCSDRLEVIRKDE